MRRSNQGEDDESMETFLKSFMLLGFTLVACSVVVMNVGWLVPVATELKGKYPLSIALEIQEAQSRKAWLEIPFYPYFVNPNISNSSAMVRPDQLNNMTFMKSSAGKHLNITKLQQEYIEHNTEQTIYSDNVKIETIPSTECYTKKRLVVDVSRSGLGNRLLATTSAVLLAVLTDRTLDLQWHKSPGCQSSYEELFTPKPVGENSYLPFIYKTDNDSIPDRHVFLPPQTRRIEESCHITVTQTHYELLSLFTEDELFKKLDKYCKILYIESNQYYGHLILKQTQYRYTGHIRHQFPSPFQNVAELLFTPKGTIMAKIDELRKMIPHKKKWLSMHVRGYFGSSKGAGWAFQCANKLLADGEIDHIVFFTESAKTVNAAKTLISSNYLDRLIIPGKMYVNDTMKHVDSMDMRDPDEMSTAVSEWYFIGEATYCMSTTIERSTFSATSIARGECKYLNYRDRDKCDPSKALVDEKKEELLYITNDHLTKDLKHLNKKQRGTIWEGVVRDHLPIDEQCFDRDSKFFEKRVSHYALLDYFNYRKHNL